MRKKTKKQLWQEAAKDPLFIKDIQDIEEDFKYADAETAMALDEYPSPDKQRELTFHETLERVNTKYGRALKRLAG